MGRLSLGRIAVDAVEVLHLRRVRLILGLPPILIICRKGASLAGKRPCGRDRRHPAAKRTKELTTTCHPLPLLLHLRHLGGIAFAWFVQDDSAKASVSMSINALPSA